MSKEFRNYSNRNQHVIQVYQTNHENQSVEFVNAKFQQYCQKFDICRMSVFDAIRKLDSIIDESDPDFDLPQISHAFQTAEALRNFYPTLDWLHLVGLIHDLGKVLLLPEFGSNQQWEVVGDTFPVGCQFSDKIVYHNFFENNPDTKNPLYNTKLGIYQENCGLANLKMSFGHDEYLYQVLQHNKCTIPQIGLDIIRFHSFYPWHKDGAYEYFETGSDSVTKLWCRRFSQCDLYTKSNTGVPDMNELLPYYTRLVEKYFPNPILNW